MQKGKLSLLAPEKNLGLKAEAFFSSCKLNKSEYFIPFYGIAKFYQNTKEERKNQENNRVIKDALSEIALIQAVGIAFLLYGGISLYQCIEKWF